MSPDPISRQTKVCPTCGTRLSENATRCMVCGSELSPTAATPRAKRSVQGSRMPEITLSLPAALGLLALILLIGATVVYFGLRSTGRVTVPTPVPTVTVTPTITAIPTETATPTLAPTATPLPPVDYTVRSGDNCGSIALTFGISIQSIILQNGLSSACTIFPGQVLKIPFPTPTVTPLPSATLEPTAAARAACDKVEYTVRENDTISSISVNYAVPMQAIQDFNGLSSNVVYLGQTLQIPLCMRAATPGPSPTPTIPPPYPAPNLLLPVDGASFTLAVDTVTLQWASIGTLRDNEAYQVTVEDVTDSQGRRIVDYVTDTKYIVPTTFRPKDNLPHIMRWTVITVRQSGTDDQGRPIWTPAGAASLQRVFSWIGVATLGTPSP